MKTTKTNLPKKSPVLSKTIVKREKVGYTKIVNKLDNIDSKTKMIAKNTEPTIFGRKQIILIIVTFTCIAAPLVFYFKITENLSFFDSLLKTLNLPLLYGLVAPVAIVFVLKRLTWRGKK